MSLSVLNPVPAAPTPVQAQPVAPKPAQTPIPVVTATTTKVDTVSISPAAHRAAADGERDAS